MTQATIQRSSKTATRTTLLPSPVELEAFHAERYGDLAKHGWRVNLRHQLGYFSPNLVYEYTINALVKEDTQWIDVGGGKTLFPENRALSCALSARCGYLVGVDPSENIHANDIIHEGHASFIEDFESDRKFDLATFRMVAEHIPHPDKTIAALDRLLKPGGRAVIFTPYRYSPVALIAGLTPFWLHPPLVKLLSGTDEEDVFPTTYLMNTRGDLRRQFQFGGFQEEAFAYLDNTATFQRSKSLLRVELLLRKGFRACGLAYPENVILGVYRKADG